MSNTIDDDKLINAKDSEGVCCENDLEICTKADVAEHARFSDEDYPCTCL